MKRLCSWVWVRRRRRPCLRCPKRRVVCHLWALNKKHPPRSRSLCEIIGLNDPGLTAIGFVTSVFLSSNFSLISLVRSP
ncbi:unnamed protein product, partial [Mesorhabditis belari]|uniref:Uncharacterized protein n=1 Tax=Mesorhabditis belari TaxID=2138241 RepID=A0AAF3F2Z3_9BILA